MKKGDVIETTMGVGVVEHFEVYPPLGKKPDPGPRIVQEMPETLPEGSFVRVGVKGTKSQVKPIAYFSMQEIINNETPPRTI